MNRLGGLALASFLLVAVAALQCGGKIVGGGGGGNSSGSGAGGNGGTAGTGGGACPVSHGTGPVVVNIGDPCDWGGAACNVAVPAGCGPDSTEDSKCVCSGGSVACPDYVPAPCVGPACPPPSSVTAGGACSGGVMCTSSIAEYDCAGNLTGYASCSCNAGSWACAISTPGCPPPPPPPPPSSCVGACAPGATCVAPGAGACGGSRVFTCQSDGTYDQGVDPCAAGDSCTIMTSCGDAACFCYPGADPTMGHIVCKGGCDGG